MLNDWQYLKLRLRVFFDTQFVRKNLITLALYHKDEINLNFKTTRDSLLLKTVQYAYNNSAYYRKILTESGIRHPFSTDSLCRAWSQIPLLDKPTIRKNQNTLICIASEKNFIGHFTTGGSTGQPFGFFTYGGQDNSHQEFFFKIIGYQPGDRILAMDGSIIPQELLSHNIFWIEISKQDLPYGSVALSSQYINNKNIIHYINFLKNFSPAIIRGYPSFIDYVAKYMLENNIKMSSTIKGIQLTAERFSDQQVERIKKAFNCMVYSQYGHSEASVFGYTIDENMTVYCSPFYGYTEVIDSNGKHVMPGELGEIVVTGFYNYAMPFIRYRTGDMAIYDGDENGLVRLKDVLGRTQDFIYTKEMEKVSLTALVFAQHYKAFDEILQWQIVQDEPGAITFKIVKGSGFSKIHERELQDTFFYIAQINSVFSFVDSIPLTPRGKSKFLVQNIS